MLDAQHTLCELGKFSILIFSNQFQNSNRTMEPSKAIHARQFESLIGEPKERFAKLLNEGKRIESTSARVDTNKRPDYFDEKRFNAAQKACQKYFSNLSFASTTGLLVLVQLDCILIPLLRTGKSRTVAELYDRYAATGKYIRKCYETDFYQPTSEGWRYISTIRGMHRRIYKIMNESSNGEIEHLPVGQKWVNQYDMALTQFAFVGLFLLKPAKCAAYYISETELAHVSYYWRVLSYYFGVEDQFNLFAYDDFRQQLDYLNLVLNHMVSELSKARKPVGTKMAEGIMFAFEDLATELSFNTLDHWWRPFVSISGLKVPNRFTLADRWKRSQFYLIFQILYRFKFVIEPFNIMYKRRFDKFCEQASTIKRKLEEKYSHIEYVG